MSAIDYSTRLQTLSGQQRDLSAYQGRALLIVNTASQCGLTPHYKGLEQLSQRFADQGLSVLGFPCNQFGEQEPGDAAQITEFCELNYGVTFDMFAKIEVNGPDTHPLYAQLKAAFPGDIGWNFAKFLVGRDGTVLKRYSPTTSPDTLTDDIEAALS